MAAFGLSDSPAYILLATTTSIVWTLKVFAIRLFMRLRINPPFGPDDWMCLLSTSMGITYSLLTILQVAHGLGSHTPDPSHSVKDMEVVVVLAWVNQFFLTLSGAFSKLSGCCLIVRIAAERRHVWGAYGLAVAVVGWLLQSLFYTAFQCDLPRPWNYNDHNGCADRWAHALATALTSYTLEALLLASAIHLVWSLNMRLTTKLRVVFAFALRLLLIPSSIIRLHYLHGQLHSAHPETFTVRIAIMTLLTCQISVISSTFPCAKPFFRAFASGALRRPRGAILPTQRARSGKVVRAGSVVGVTGQRDRRGSLAQLRLGPVKGEHSAVIEYVPPETAAQMHRPSLGRSKHSGKSIVYSRSYDVSFQDLGGLLDQPSPTSMTTQREKLPRGSNAGFSWSSGRRISSQRSKTGSGEMVTSVREGEGETTTPGRVT